MTVDTYIAANTFKGFDSYFDELIHNDENNKVYLIKGGPGCGKSTLMKKIAEFFENDNYDIEKIYCSSDPNSLDGIKIADKNIVIIDATPPHSFDMKYPGIIDNIIDISKCWNEEKLSQSKENIKFLFDDISQRYKSVYSTLHSAGILYLNLQMQNENHCNKEKILSFIKKYVKQNAISPVQKEAKICNRFLSSISCDGIVTKTDTIMKMCDKGIIINDEMNISSSIISMFVSYFRRSGYDIILFHNPLCPEKKIDHMIIPDLKFGIISTNNIFELIIDTKNFKQINSKIFIDKDFVSENKNKISLKKKIIAQLLGSATIELKYIKELHDKLEKYYINSIDFNHLDKLTRNIINSFV